MKKVELIIVLQCGKNDTILITLKKRLFWVFQIEEIRDKDNETGLKDGGVIEMSNYSASIHYNNNYNLVQ